jgi:putative transposase
MRRYRQSSHSKHDLKVHLIWVAKYRKRILRGPVATRTRDLIRQIAMAHDHDLHIISGKVAKDPVHVFINYRPMQTVSDMVKWLKGTSSRVLVQEFAHLRKQCLGRHLWACGYCAISSGTITDDMIDDYISEQEGVDFPIFTRHALIPINKLVQI